MIVLSKTGGNEFDIIAEGDWLWIVAALIGTHPEIRTAIKQ
jgi:hypothetical protein